MRLYSPCRIEIASDQREDFARRHGLRQHALLIQETPVTNESTRAQRAQTPSGLNHLVLNVRDMEASHLFWTECLGFRQTGTIRRAAPDGRERALMRFYSRERDGKLTHHDIALFEMQEPEQPPGRPVFNHVAITYSDRAAWEAQIAFLAGRGVVLERRVERGATNSVHLEDPEGNEIELVFELPREQWEIDIDAALNHAVVQPVLD